ncbi:MAG: molecular chaperone HtpG [Leptospirales bacterium]|nr:molecular chaperone HtpG [Leptospirales bacterium]
MQRGKLSVQTGNLLPIIKKWLYSEKEIFLRELISNAFDAINKLNRIRVSEEIRNGDDLDFAINLKIDRENGILSIEDNGIGMDGAEIERYIAQIAFSGAQEFINKYEQSGDRHKAGIIGNFGLGFYSSFMVADRVDIDSLSYRGDSAAAFWSSDGGEEYEIGEGQRARRGTEIRLHLNQESRDLLDKTHLQGLVRRYCDFLPIAIQIDGARVNRESAPWTKNPSELKPEDYQEFYRTLYPMQPEPLFWVHLNVDYPFQLQGILYFPHLAHEMDLNKSEVRIFCKQVFVTDEAQELIPKYLTVLQGVIDIPDLPLNVSRSYLQNEPQIKKIAQHIVKKVADRLQEERTRNAEHYRSIWNELAPFVKYAMLNDEKFFEQARGALLFELAGEAEDRPAERFVTLDEYREKTREKLGDRALYVSDLRAQAGPLKLLRSQGLSALLLNSMIDAHFVQFLESKEEGLRFVRADAELGEHLVDQEHKPSLADAGGQSSEERLSELFKKAIANDKVTIRVEGLRSDDIPALVIFPEQMRRFSEMAAMMSRGEAPPMPLEHTLVLNAKNAIVQALGRPAIISSEAGPSKQELIARQLYFLARLAQGAINHHEIEALLDASYAALARTL